MLKIHIDIIYLIGVIVYAIQYYFEFFIFI